MRFNDKELYNDIRITKALIVTQLWSEVLIIECDNEPIVVGDLVLR